MSKKNKKQVSKDFAKQAKKLDWDELAFEIIAIEYSLHSETRPKFLKLLELKLNIFEEDKMSRV